jgi:hypothetical protein
MIEVRYKGRLGNNLFQYCLGRILSEALGFALQANAIPGFPGTAETVAGATHEGPVQVLTGQIIDLEGIVADQRPRRIVIDGWLQRYDYYRPHRDRIRQWLAFDPAIRVPDVPPEVVVVSVRRTDYVRIGWAMPFSFYEDAINRLLPNGGSICIVTDDRRDPFFRHFARWRPSFFSRTALEDMRFMAGARRLIMSQSTFSWWPTFLGNPQEVVCPVSAFGAWSPRGGEASDADLMERDRFVCIEAREPYRATRREVWHQRRRWLWRRAVLLLNRQLELSIPVPLQ